MPGLPAGYRTENLALAAVLTTAAFACLAVVSVLAKVASQYTSTGVLLLFQNLIGLLFVTPAALRGGRRSLRTAKIGLHVLRAATGTAAWYALFFAITLIPLANATMLMYSAPLWMPVIAWIATRRRVSAPTWIGAGVGFAGMMLVLQPQAQGVSLGEIVAVAGALLLAVAMMTVRRLGATEPVTRVLFYYFLLSSLMAIPIAALDWQPFGAQAWAGLIGLGTAQLLSQVLIVLAYRYASAEKVGPFFYSVIVFTAMLDWLIWNHPPTLFMFAGMALVIGGGIVAVRAKPTGRSAEPTSSRYPQGGQTAVPTG